MDWRELMSLESWQESSALGGFAYLKRSLGKLDTLDQLVRTYHSTAKKLIPNRINQLTSIITEVGNWLIDPPPAEGGFAWSVPATVPDAVEELGRQASEKRAYLQAVVQFYQDHPSESTATLDAFEGLADKPTPRPRILQRRKSLSDLSEPADPTPQTPSKLRRRASVSDMSPSTETPELALGDHYQIERADPLHRTTHAVMGQKGLGMSALLALWSNARTLEADAEGATDLPFFYWLEEQDPTKLEMSSVAYLSQEGRRPYLLFVAGGTFYCVDDTKPKSTKLFDTSDMGNASDNNKIDWCIFVLSPNDVLFGGSYRMGEFHRSSFFSGAKVKSAGQLCILNGKLVGITPKSGHYKPGAAELCAALEFLSKRGVLLNKVDIWYPEYGEQDPEAHPFQLNAKTFLANGGKFDTTTAPRVPPDIYGFGRPNPELQRRMEQLRAEAAVAKK